MKAGRDKKKKHQTHYDDHVSERTDERARERGEPVPRYSRGTRSCASGRARRSWRVAPDCRLLCFLVDFEHAKGGSHHGGAAGAVVVSGTTAVARADYDTANMVYQATDRDMTAADRRARRPRSGVRAAARGVRRRPGATRVGAERGVGRRGSRRARGS